MEQTLEREVYRPGESWVSGSSAKRERVDRYVDWLLQPSGDRGTKTAFAESIGVSLQTLSNYEKDAYFHRKLGERSRQVARAIDLPAILRHLADMATGGADSTPAAQVSAAKTLLDWMDKTEPVRTEGVNLDELTDQDLIEVAMKALQLAGEKES